MSQSGSLFVTPPVGAGVQYLGDGTLDNNVGPDLGGLISILGTAGDVIVAYNTHANAVTLSTVGNAASFDADVGAAVPVAGVLKVFGTANKVTTAAEDDKVTISLPNNVTIPGDFQAANVVSSGAINCATVVTTGIVTVGGNISITGNMSGVANIVCSGIISTTSTIGGFVSYAALEHFAYYTTYGDIATVHGNLGTVHGRVSGKTLIVETTATISSLNVPGILSNTNAGLIQSSAGANGQVLIGGGAAPAWRNLTAGNGIVVGNLANSITIGLNNNIVLPGTFGASSVTSDNLMTASNGLTVSSGNVTITTGNVDVSGGTMAVRGSISSTHAGISAAGTIVSNNLETGFRSYSQIGHLAFFTENGDISAFNGNIVASGGTIIGSHLNVTFNATIDSLNVPGILSNTNTGLIQSSAGTNGQVLIGGGAAPAWRNITAGTGISITNAANSITITNSGVGGVKAAFFAQLNAPKVNISGDGSTYLFKGPDLTESYDTTNSFSHNTNPARFVAPVNGIYQFTLSVSPSAGSQFFHYTNTLNIYAPGRTYILTRTPIITRDMQGTQGDISQLTTNIQLTIGQQVSFGFESQSGTGVKNCSLVAYDTYITGFQIS